MKRKASDNVCTDCSLAASLPLQIWCIDCGDEVEISEFDNETCRCVDCKNQHDKIIKSQQNKRAYQAKKKKKIQ